MALRGDHHDVISLASNPILHQRTKHIGIQYHYIRDEVDAKRTETRYVLVVEILAAGLTKVLLSLKRHAFISNSEWDPPSLPQRLRHLLHR